MYNNKISLNVNKYWKFGRVKLVRGTSINFTIKLRIDIKIEKG